MFYCEACRVKKSWPDSMMKSRGRCEICGESAVCNDRPSSTLPVPKTCQLIVTRGLQASGKTTWAKNWVAQDVRKRARVERDALRAMMHDSVWKGHHTENQVKSAQRSMVANLLQHNISVVVSDTNLDELTFASWKELMTGMRMDHVEFKVQDFRDVPLEVCLERNAKRTGREFIPEDAIKSAYNRYILGV